MWQLLGEHVQDTSLYTDCHRNAAAAAADAAATAREGLLTSQAVKTRHANLIESQSGITASAPQKSELLQKR